MMAPVFTTPIKRFPNWEWNKATLDGKRQWLISSEQAADYREACALLAKHGAAVRAYRKAKKAFKAERSAK